MIIGIFNRKNLLYIAFTTVVGSVVLASMSILQKAIIGAPILNFAGYIVPSLFGGGTGLVYGFFSVGKKRRIRDVERESEYRSVLYEVNQTLVRADDVEEMVPKIVDILGSCSFCDCIVIYILNATDTEIFGNERDDLCDADVRALQNQEFIDAVFKKGFLIVEEGTDPANIPGGVETLTQKTIYIAISHKDKRYGVLKAHLSSESAFTETEIDLLETIANDIAYFIYNRDLEAEHRSLADLVERIDDPVMLQNLDGSFQVINEALTNLAKKEKDDLVGKEETVAFDEKTAQVVQEKRERVIESEEPVSYQVTAEFLGGRERTFSTTCYPYYDESGELDGTIAIFRDITDYNEQQRQLQILDRVLRHNVNNNMNVVQGYGEILREETSGELEEHARKILSNSETLLDISNKQRKITEFLSEPPQKETVDIVETVERAVNRVHSEYPHAEISSECPAVECQGNEAIGDAIEELLTNAIIHSDMDQPRVTVDGKVREDQVTMSVADTNQTMPEMEREILKGGAGIDAIHHGSGLGLWYVKLIVDHLDGTVEFEPNEPRGNIVRFSLPR